MRRIALACVGLAALASLPAAAKEIVILPDPLLDRYGLEKAWTSQMEMDPSRDRIQALSLDVVDQPDPDGLRRDLLFCQTREGLLQAMDAETGRTLWTAQIGSRRAVHMPPTANDRFVAVISGTDLNILERETGRPIMAKSLKSVPSQSAIMGPDLVYVPSISGHITAYGMPRRGEDGEWNISAVRDRTYQSFGRIDVEPIITRESLLWATSRGFVFVTSHNMNTVRFRFDTRAAISAPLGYRAPHVLVASRDGYVYAVHEYNGFTPWRFTSGSPINQPPVPIGESVYVIPQDGGVFSLSVANGSEQWFAPRGKQWVAGSPNRIYVKDDIGQLLVIDSKTGGQIGTLPTESYGVHLTNQLTDRVYLSTPSGMLVCLRGQDQPRPVLHQLPVVPTAPEGEGTEPPAAEDDEPVEPNEEADEIESDEEQEEIEDEAEEMDAEEDAEAEEMGDEEAEDVFGEDE
jgi:outer membrane protein assembly factor BamB